MNNAYVKSFMEGFATAFEYAYATIYDAHGNVTCEGFVSSLSRTMDLAALPVKSFYVFDAEDGGTFVELRIA